VVTTSLPRTALLGLTLGAAWGVLARVWMRLISTSPEFSWSGTLGIIGLAATLGAGVGLVHAARRGGRSRWWTLAAVPGLVLFLSPGLLLAPAFLLGGLARGARGRVGQVVGLLAVASSVGLATYAVVALPDPGAPPPDALDVVVFEIGFVAMTLSLAWASSLVWQRTGSRRPSAAEYRQESPTTHQRVG
jgi:hypothetical protein